MCLVLEVQYSSFKELQHSPCGYSWDTQMCSTGFGESSRLIQWLKEKFKNVHYDFAQNGCWIIIKPVGSNL